jgi:lysophospholipase L1-like esterase
VTARAPPAPATPTDLTAAAVSSTRIALAWQDNASDEGGYEVRRSTDGPGGPYSLRATLAAGAASFEDTGLAPETQYCYRVRAEGAGGAPDSPLTSAACATTPEPPLVRVALFGDSNTDRCIADPDDRTSYVSVAPALGPDAPHRACQVAGKIEAGWEALSRSETIRAVNHAISSTATGGGGFGWQDRTTQGSPNARTVVNGTTRFEAEILGAGFPWSGGEPANQYFPNGAVTRVNAFVPGPADFAYVSMGTNDADASRNMTATQTEANLRWMVERWLAAGRAADHFILTTLPPRWGAPATAIPERNALIRALAAELGVHLIDLAAMTSDDDGTTWRSATLHVGDGIHYTDAVRGLIADEVVGWMTERTPAE